MEVGLIRKIDIDKEMQQSYLDYAMSTIVARALPDARDGLKPVHRRILYAMYDMGLRPDASFKKSARIVGEVLGKYHPHGDAAVYEAMARMAQEFSMRYPLVEGQGNFGSIDGDPPAAMRYTEARLAAPAVDILTDLHKNTVSFIENFDSTLKEPTVLPSAIPNLLVNGAMGIAVGMSTNIPPHNLAEVVDALKYMLNHWEKQDDIDVDQLMKFIKGPDFPTGGIILDESESGGLKSAYGTGRGTITVQAKAHMEDMGRGKKRIIVNELPYMTNKAALIERIADLIREGKLEGISDLRDESDREGMRIVIELSKTDDPESVLRDLYKRTPMRSTFGIITLALVNGEPRMLSLKQALRVFLEHRLEVVRLRSEYDLEKARERAHVLEGLRIALANLDEIITLIRRSPDAETARERLIKRFKLSEIQANAILNMPLRRLASLERQKIEAEYKEVLQIIKDLESILSSPQKMREVIAGELTTIREAYGDRRRTLIVALNAGESKSALLTASDLTPDHKVWISITPEGLVSRTLDENPPRLSGRAAPAWLLQAYTRDTIYLVSTDGKTAAVAVHTLPQTETPGDGIEFHRVCPLTPKDSLAAVLNLPPKEQIPEGWFVFSATQGGMVKKSPLEELPGPTAQSFTLVKVNEGDRLGWVMVTDGKKEILMVTSQGMGIRFNEEEVRPMGLVAAGVMGIKLQVSDMVVGCATLPQKGDILLVRTDGQAKRVKESEFPMQGRYGQGVQAWKVPPRNPLAGMGIGSPTTRAILHLDQLTAKAIRFDDAPLRSRPANGQNIVDLKSGNYITRLTVLESHERPGTAQVKPQAVKKTKPAGSETVKTPEEPAPEKPGPMPSPKAAKVEAAPRSGKTKTAKGSAPSSKKTTKSTQAVKAATPDARPAKTPQAAKISTPETKTPKGRVAPTNQPQNTSGASPAPEEKKPAKKTPSQPALMQLPDMAAPKKGTGTRKTPAKTEAQKKPDPDETAKPGEKKPGQIRKKSG